MGKHSIFSCENKKVIPNPKAFHVDVRSITKTPSIGRIGAYFTSKTVYTKTIAI